LAALKWYVKGQQTCHIFIPEKIISITVNQYVDFVYQHRLYIETGRYKNIPRNERLCKNCSANEIEDEAHFLIKSEKFH
jgi:hypothetical protein